MANRHELIQEAIQAIVDCAATTTDGVKKIDALVSA